MNDGARTRLIALHAGVVVALFAAHYLLPAYHQGVVSRVMVLAVYAIGYNLVFGYAGMLSLGHATFFAAGMYGAGLPVYHDGWTIAPAFLFGIGCGAALAAGVGVLALRTTGVAFMIVTMMFGQVGYLLALWFGDWTRGEEGLTIAQGLRVLGPLDLTDPSTRYFIALALLATALAISLAIVRSRFGRTLVAIRENEERTRMLGYDTFRTRLAALVMSGALCAAAGAAYTLLFGYIGAGFANVPYSILPLLWVLVGGAATVLGPLVGTLVMFYLIDLSNDVLNRSLSVWDISYLGVVGLALVLLILFFPKGIMGTLRERWLKWLP